MDINRGSAELEVFFVECRAEWTEAMNAAKENLILNKVAMQVPSKSSSTRHAWLRQLPAMRKWTGDRIINNLQSQTLNITNDKFENTIEITREEFEDDIYDLYKPSFGIMGRQSQATKDRMLVDAFLQGTTALWGGDNAAVFGTTRQYGSATISNYATTGFDSAGSVLTGIIKLMRSYLGHAGQPLMVKPVVLLHGPNLYDTVHKAIKNSFTALVTGDTTITRVGGDIANPNANIVELVLTEYLVDGYVDLDANTYSNAGKAFALVGESMGVRAGLVYQSRIEPELQDQRARFDASADVVFLQDKLQWGVRMRGKAFVGMPHLIHGNFPTSYGS
jgi:phage major head subunit gpT-like protein